MSKITSLSAAQELLTVTLSNTARHHLLGWPRHPDDTPPEERLVNTSLLLAEIEDHLYHLTTIADACRHSLAGTVPLDYYLEPSTYDPWVVIAEQFADEYRLPVSVLSPALLAWLDAWPELARSSAAKTAEILGDTWAPWVMGDDGRLRPPTEAEKQQIPELDLLATIGRTAFTLTYATDMATIAGLSASHSTASSTPQVLARVLELVE